MFPGTSTLNQLARLCEYTGMPTPEDIESVQSPFATALIESIPVTTKKYCKKFLFVLTCFRSFADLYPKASPKALDLITRLLVFDPKGRLLAEVSFRLGD